MIDVADTADITDDNVTVDSHPEQESAQSVAPPVQAAEDADGPDGVTVQVCPHRPHQVPGPVQAHLVTISLYVYC